MVLMTRDTRTFITVHDGMPDNKKIRPLSDKAFRTLVEVWCWCSRERNDGRFDRAAWATFGTPKARAELLARDLIKPTADGGFEVHDYLRHQRSRAEIDDLTVKRREAGAAGGRARASRQASATASVEASAKAHGKRAGTKSQPETETSTEDLPDGSSSPPKPPTGGRGQRIPEPFLVTTEMRVAMTTECPGLDIDAATRRFVDYWRGRAGAAARKTDWVATWRNWMRKTYDDMGSFRQRPPTRTEQNLAVLAEMEAKYGTDTKGLTA